MTRHITRRRMLLGLGLLTGVPLLAACGASSPATSRASSTTTASSTQATKVTATVKQASSLPAAANQGKITLRTMHSWDATFWKRQVSFDQMFMKNHPNIVIQADNVPWAQWPTKLSTELAAGDAVDVQYCQYAFARAYIYEGAFINLTPYMNRNPHFALDKFTPMSLPSYRFKGNMYEVPYDTGPIIIFYNIDMFEKYNVPLPKNDWTLDDFLQTAKELTKGTGVNHIWGYEGPAGMLSGEVNTNIMFPFGAAYLNADEDKFLATTSQALEALQWWADLRLKYHVNPTPADTKVVPGDPFAYGKMGMMWNGSWAVPWLHAQAKFRYDVAPFPRGPVKHSTSAEGSGYAITKDSKHRDAAWTYIEAYLGPAGVDYMWAETGRGSPARISAWPVYFKSPLAPKNAKNAVYDALMHYSSSQVIQSINGQEISRIGNAIWDKVMLQQLSVKDALNEAKSQLAPVLEKNKKYAGLFG